MQNNYIKNLTLMQWNRDYRYYCLKLKAQLGAKFRDPGFVITIPSLQPHPNYEPKQLTLF